MKVNPFSKNKQYKQWRDWRDENLPETHGDKYSKYTTDHQLKAHHQPNIRNDNPYKYSKDFKSWQKWLDENDPTFHGNRYSKFDSNHQLKFKYKPRPKKIKNPPRPRQKKIKTQPRPKTIRDRNPYSFRRENDKWARWLDLNDPSFWGTRFSHYTKDGELKDALKQKLTRQKRVKRIKDPQPLKSTRIEERFLEETGTTLEEANQINCCTFYREELQQLIALTEKTPRRVKRHMQQVGLDPDYLRRCDFIIGKSKSLRLSPELQKKLDLTACAFSRRGLLILTIVIQ